MAEAVEIGDGSPGHEIAGIEELDEGVGALGAACLEHGVGAGAGGGIAQVNRTMLCGRRIHRRV